MLARVPCENFFVFPSNRRATENATALVLAAVNFTLVGALGWDTVLTMPFDVVVWRRTRAGTLSFPSAALYILAR
jgi:hypothetical protein